MNIQITFPYHRFSVSWKKIIEKLTMFPMSPDDHLLTNRKKSLIRSKQTPDPSVQFLVNMQTTDNIIFRISGFQFFSSGFRGKTPSYPPLLYQHNYFLLRFMIKLLWNWAILMNAFVSIFFDWSTESGSTYKSRFHTIASVFLEKRLLKNWQCFQCLMMTICWRIGKNPSSNLSKHKATFSWSTWKTLNRI
jgi:hypothetical protein